VDHEEFHKLLVTASKGDFSFQANTVSREKGLPTGAYATIFNDGRTRTTDGLSLASLTYHRALSNSASFSTRLHAGRYTYDGEYAYYTDQLPNKDISVGEWVGLELDAARKIGTRQFLTVGAEFRDNFKQFLTNYDPEPYVLYSETRNSSMREGVFAQDEIKLADPLMLYAGVRLDHYDGFGLATSPRLALIYTPTPATTLKLLAGRAFRAPNEFELYSVSPGYTSNRTLEPEHIETLELIAQQFIGGGVQISASAFRNRLTDLIEPSVDPANPYFYGNLASTHSRGLELGLEVNRGHGLEGQLSYSLQRTEDRATSTTLTNSPGQMVQAQLRSPIPGTGVIAAMDAQYMSDRRTVAGNVAGAHTLTNFSLFAPRTLGRFDLSATVYNVFGTRYGDPVREGFAQDVIAQDGRSFRVRTTLHY
ncbi:MAG TPA: TonB-dependent receptor, partial [Gemmatimonadaceae bacterium]|nr:TonB-dependent receptor [Gemmatimonadaceae bacterium]